MKRLIQYISFVILLGGVISSCDSGNIPPLSQQKMWECHYETEWDSLSTKEYLIGEWKWTFIGCFWAHENANGDEFKGLTIEFKSDNTLDVKENGVLVQTSIWKLVESYEDLYELNVEPSVDQLYGHILICDERILFNHSFIDGCDNYFVSN